MCLYTFDMDEEDEEMRVTKMGELLCKLKMNISGNLQSISILYLQT